MLKNTVRMGSPCFKRILPVGEHYMRRTFLCGSSTSWVHIQILTWFDVIRLSSIKKSDFSRTSPWISGSPATVAALGSEVSKNLKVLYNKNPATWTWLVTNWNTSGILFEFTFLIFAQFDVIWLIKISPCLLIDQEIVCSIALVNSS